MYLEIGSSTACIMVLDKKSQMLHSANLGDSGFLVIRRGSVVHQSSEMQHYFNTPYQLAIPPPGQAGTVIEDRCVWIREGLMSSVSSGLLHRVCSLWI